MASKIKNMKRLFDIVASGWHGESHPSVFQTRERDDFYSIGTSVGHVSACQDKKQVGLAEWSLMLCLVVLLYQSFDFKEVCGTILYLTAAKFAFYECIASVFKMEHQVGLQTIAVAIVGYVAIKVGSISPKVAYTHLLKDETEGLKLGFQCLGIDTHSGYGNRRVAKATLGHAADGCLAADGGTPGVNVLYDEELLQGTDIVVEGGCGESYLARRGDIGKDATFLCQRADVAGIGPQDLACNLGVALPPVDGGDVIVADAVDVVPCHHHACLGRELECGRPSTSARHTDESGNVKFTCPSVDIVGGVVEQFMNGHFAGRVKGFPKAHGEHLHA